MPSRWTYADWITLDGAARLTRLRLHIEEVSNFTQGTATRGQSVTPVDPQYLQTLLKEEKELARQLNPGATGGGFGCSSIKFIRD